MEQQIESGSARRAQKASLRQGRAIQVSLVSVVVFVNALRLGAPWWLAAIGCAALIAVAFRVDLRAARRMDELGSLADLRARIDRSSGRERVKLTWYEYAIARCVLSGTYSDEPPADFVLDVRQSSTRMGLGSRYLVTDAALVFVVIALVTFLLMFPLQLAKGDRLDGSWFGIFALALVLIFGITAIWLAVQSRSRLSRLGRRVEDAAALMSQDRWQELLEVARVELSLDSPHS